ncbi:MAG: LacI family DNA-binding transcriptional regulator [Solirubrobacterales bacterium]|nr:LacI family DNA-binding transcriptional regulator [Solirubrobacterales bacterium]
MTNRRPSINDIAREAAVSAATVSLGLRDKGRMSDETRTRIKELADQMGYVPNSNARSLVGGKTQLISVSMPGISHHPEVMVAVEYYFRLLGAVASKALELNHGLLITSSSKEAGRVAVDGAVVVDPSLDDPTIAAFDRIGLPVVTIGRRLGDNVKPEKDLVVDNDFTTATGDVLDHLRERGARTITLFAAEPIDSFQRDTIDSYLEWCERHDVESRVVMSNSPSPADAERAARNVVAGSNRPDGVYATVDTLAEALLIHVEGEGLAVPGDIRIATCSDSQTAKSTSPKLTTIDERPVELGEAAVTMLIAAINDEDVAPTHVQVGTELLIRESTA